METSAWLAAQRIETPRLWLEPLRIDHAEELAPLLDDPTLHEYVGGDPATLEQLRERYARLVVGHSADQAQGWLNWVIRERDAGAAVGTVQATLHHEYDQTTADVAWVIAAGQQRRGYAAEAAGAMVDWMRGQGVCTMSAYIHPEHEASMAVARRLGLEPTTEWADGEVRWAGTAGEAAVRDSQRRECAETNGTKGTTLTTHGATLEKPLTTSAGFRLAGVALHFYTATGAVFGFLVVVAAFQGAFERALWLGLVALIIDGTDGMTARWLRVSETIPSFDGARLDDIVDYITYAFAPMVLLWTTSRLPDGAAGQVLACIPLLASTYQFCRTDAKTADHFFLGFPSYWNVVAFYVFVLDFGSTVTAVILLICSILVFVPIRYVYPSRTKVFRGLNIGFTALWLATYAILLVQHPDPKPVVIALSFAYLVYYAGLSLYLTLVLPRLPAKRLSKDAIAAELDD